MILRVVQEYETIFIKDITRILYLAEREWFFVNKKTYSDIDYFRWNGGIFSRDINQTIEEMKEFEITEKDKKNHLFEPTYDKIKTEFRLKDVEFDKTFEKFFNKTLKKKFHSSEEIYGKIFSLPEIKDAELGNLLLKRNV